MPKVYITQVPHRRDPDTGVFYPTVNIAPASEHGEVHVMMPPQASFHATGDLVRQLREELADYDYERGDALVCMGDPAIIAAASAVLGKYQGQFRLLKWDRNVRRYLPAVITV